MNEMTIKEARLAAGLTQEGVTKEIGIPRRTIQDWERGINHPPAWVERLVIEKLKTIKKEEQ